MRFWFFIIVFALAIGVGIFIQKDPGYALFSYQHWTVEMPLWLAAISVILLMVVISIVFSILSGIFSSSSRIQIWWRHHKELSARQQFVKGLLELTEGRWKKAERYLTSSAALSDAPLINYLAAARAADESGASNRRDQYLKRAKNLDPKYNVAVQLTTAELQFNQGDLEQSAATLEHLRKEEPKHPQVLKSLCTIYERMNHWEPLYKLLPTLKKAEVFKSKEAYELFEEKVYSGMIIKKSNESEMALKEFWKSLPKNIKQEPDCAYHYVQQLLKHHDVVEAEKILRNLLQHHWQHRFITLYGKIKTPELKKQISFAESFLKDHPNDAILLLMLGRLSLANQLWGKARDYLEQSLTNQPSPEGYALLGQLMDRLGDVQRRDECFKKGLLFVTENKLQVN